MILICPSCGVRLEKDLKFCPNCGYELNESPGEKDTPKPNVIVCKDCGEENKPGSNYCAGCGKKLSSKEDRSKPGVVKIQPAKKLNKNMERVSLSPPVAPNARTLSQKQIISIVAVALGIVLIILYASGAFESAPIPASLPVQQQTQTQSQPLNQNQPVDLNTINEINILEAKVKADPNDLESLVNLAHLKNDSRMFEQAIQNYKEYLAKKPSDADARVDMGTCYFNLQNYPAAIAEMKKALEYNPKHQIAHLNLGIVNLASGNLEESGKWLQKAVDIDPNSEVGKRAKELMESHK